MYPIMSCVQAMFIPTAEAQDTSYFMSRYIWNPEDEHVQGESDFDEMSECSASCSSGSHLQDEDVRLHFRIIVLFFFFFFFFN